MVIDIDQYECSVKSAGIKPALPVPVTQCGNDLT